MSDYNFSVVIQTLDYEIKIDPSASYGYFEHQLGGEGGLWFQMTENEEGFRQMELIDYDGVYQLPTQVAYALRKAGYLVDETFD